jgi:TonB family protein
MNTLINYMFWASAYLFLLGTVYHFIIRPQGNPTFSRSFILGGLVISVVAGTGIFFRTAGITIHEMGGVLTLPEVVVYASEGLENSQLRISDYLFTKQGLLHLSFAISMLVFLRFAGSLVYLVAKWRILKGKKINGLFVIPMRGDHTPFSFFRLVFIPERLLGAPGFDQVLLHERAHIIKLHSLDLVCLELLSIFFWFHPVIWYLRREIKMQHEFEADRYVLNHKVDKTFYQRLLINYSLRTYCLPITNPFNFSPLKKRVMMMNKQSKKSITGMILGILATLTLFTGMLLLQSISLDASETAVFQNQPLNEFPGNEVTLPETTSHLQTLPQPQPPVPPTVSPESSEDAIFTVVENPPSFPGGDEARIRFLLENISYPSEAREAGLQGTVFISFVVEKDGSISDAKVLRGVAESLDAEALRVIKAMPNWNPGTQRGEHVRVQYNMPIRFALNGGDKKDEGTDAGKALDSVTPRWAEEVVFFIDGKKMDADIEQLNDIIKPEEIESINVIKNETARELYGYDNVILITRKKP